MLAVSTTQQVLVMTGFISVIIATMIILVILLKRQHKRIHGELALLSTQYGWSVTSEQPQWAKEALRSVELVDFHTGSLLRPLIVSQVSNAIQIIVFGYNCRGIDTSTLTGHVVGLALIQGTAMPAIEFEKASLVNRWFNNLPHEIKIDAEWGRRWHITTNDELASLAFLSKPNISEFAWHTRLTNIAFNSNVIMCAGGRSDTAENYASVYEQLRQLSISVSETKT